MIGQTIESRRTFPLGAVCALLVGLGLDVTALVLGNIHWAIASILPLMVGAVLALVRKRNFRAHFTDTALEVEHPRLSIPYEDIQGLRTGKRPANPYQKGPRGYAIQVIHGGGVLSIPRRLNVPSDQVYGFLFHHLSGQGDRWANPALENYRRRKEADWGADRVWCYSARPYLGRGAAHPRFRNACLAACLAGVVWVVVGGLRGEPAWVASGVVAALLGGLCALLLVVNSRAKAVNKTLRGAGLVICPDGLALVQGDLTGELRWDEVRDVKLAAAPGSFRLSSGLPGPAIVLKVAGAAIPILDVYDRPLPVIHQLLSHYWRGDKDRDRREVWHFDATLAEEAEASARESTGITSRRSRE